MLTRGESTGQEQLERWCFIIPELPEVETIRLGLEKLLVGHKILNVEILTAKTFQGDKKNVIGAKVIEIDRIGKGLLIELSNGYIMAIHLKLTGQVIYSGKETGEVHLSSKTGGSLPSNFTRVIFKLDSGSKLYFNDLRKFGWIKIIKSSKLKVQSFFREMGPEPPVISSSKFKVQSSKLKSKTVLTLDKFREITARTISPIKIILMDQKRIGGVGNIYANEALFLAGIDPRRPSKSLKDKEVEKLYKSLLEVLKNGLKYGGSSDVNFVNAIGEEGQYQDHLLIYGKKGQKCKGCLGIVQKTQLGGRGTYFCPACQS